MYAFVQTPFFRFRWHRRTWGLHHAHRHAQLYATPRLLCSLADNFYTTLETFPRTQWCRGIFFPCSAHATWEIIANCGSRLFPWRLRYFNDCNETFLVGTRVEEQKKVTPLLDPTRRGMSECFNNMLTQNRWFPTNRLLYLLFLRPCLSEPVRRGAKRGWRYSC